MNKRDAEILETAWQIAEAHLAETPENITFPIVLSDTLAVLANRYPRYYGDARGLFNGAQARRVATRVLIRAWDAGVDRFAAEMRAARAVSR